MDADLRLAIGAGATAGARRRQLPPRAVINMGISGNRVLREGAGSSALARFDRDVLSRPGAKWVLLLEGINDIGFSATRRAAGQREGDRRGDHRRLPPC